MIGLEVRNLSKTIGKINILKNINFNIASGEIVALIGPNGAGKSTAMKSIASLIYPDCGEIHICGYNLATERESALSYISAMIEAPPLYMQFNGLQHLKMVASLRKLKKSAIDEAIEFSHLKEKIHDKVTRYSMGMKQRLYLTMCVMSKPKLLLLDEPTNGLDLTSVLEFCNEIRSLATAGTSVLISSHILGDLQKISDKFIFIKEGEIQAVIKSSDGIELEKLYLDMFGGHEYV